MNDVLGTRRVLAPALGMMFTVEFDWEPVGNVTLDAAGKLAFPRLPTEPGVYRFRLTESGPSAVYVGETVVLRQRIALYRNPDPTQRTNMRVHARFLGHLLSGGDIEMSIARTVKIELDGQTIVQRLAHTPERRLVENLALIAADAEGVDHIENL